MNLRIDQEDMHLRDGRALELLRTHSDPQTNRTTLKVNDIATELRCHRNTVTQILNRLEGAGHIKRHPYKPAQAESIEICPLSETVNA